MFCCFSMMQCVVRELKKGCRGRDKVIGYTVDQWKYTYKYTCVSRLFSLLQIFSRKTPFWGYHSIICCKQYLCFGFLGCLFWIPESRRSLQYINIFWMMCVFLNFTSECSICQTLGNQNGESEYILSPRCKFFFDWKI